MQLRRLTSLRLSHKAFCYTQRLQGVHLISKGSDQTTDVQAQSVQADLTLRTNFIVSFAISWHKSWRSTLGKIFNRHFGIFFSFFNLTFHANCLHCMKCQILFLIAWNAKSCFLGNNKKNKQICRLLNLPRVVIQNLRVRYPWAPSVVYLSKTCYLYNLVLVATQEDSV